MLLLGGVQHETFSAEPLQQSLRQLFTVVVVLVVLVLQASPNLGNCLQALRREHAYLLHGYGDTQSRGHSRFARGAHPRFNSGMPALARRRDHDRREECWLIYYGDIHIGTIAIRSASPRPAAVGLALRLLSGIGAGRVRSLTTVSRNGPRPPMNWTTRSSRMLRPICSWRSTDFRSSRIFGRWL